MIDDSENRGNIFKAKPGAVTPEVIVIVLIVSALLIATVGSQVYIWHLESSISGYWLTELIFFNLPVHFWLTGQFLPLWFLLLGVVFNLWMDRNEVRRMEGIIRFRAVGRSKEEVDRT